MDNGQDLLQSGLGGPNIELVRLPRAVSILVVEAVDVDAGLAVSVLSADSGVIVKVAPDRQSALHLLADSHVHLIPLGVEEDESDAIDLLAELNELEHTCWIPVVVLAMPVDGRSLDLKPLPALPAALPTAKDLFVPDRSAASLNAYSTDLETIRTIAMSHTLTANLPNDPLGGSYVLDDDGRPALEQFVEHLSAR